jgi:hypothetical protein
MKNKDIIALSKGSEDYNTCNDWGFAGTYGKQYSFESGLTISIGKRSYRHMKSTPHKAWYYPEIGKIHDEPKSINSVVVVVDLGYDDTDEITGQQSFWVEEGFDPDDLQKKVTSYHRVKGHRIIRDLFTKA